LLATLSTFTYYHFCKKLQVLDAIELCCFASLPNSCLWPYLILHRFCFTTLLVKKTRVIAWNFSATFTPYHFWGVIGASLFAAISNSFFWSRLILHRSCFTKFLVEKSRVFGRRFFCNFHTLSLLVEKNHNLSDASASSFSYFWNSCSLFPRILHWFCFTTTSGQKYKPICGFSVI